MFSLDNSRAFLLLSLVVIVLISSCNSETLDYNNWNCRTELRSINETKDYYYKSNLTDLLDTLSIKSLDNYSFHNDTSSNGVIYGLFLCRGDFSSNDCQRCVGNLRSFTNRNCSSGRRSITWLEDQCMIRYSDINFFGVADTEYFSGSLIGENYSSPADAKLGILDLMTELVDEALKSDKLFKAGNRALENGNGFVYGSVQCTRDLNSTECSKCLKRFMKEIRDFCEAGIECKVLASSCLLRYANSSFIEQPPVSPSLSTLPLLPPSPSQRPPSGNGTTRTVIVIVVTTVIAMIFVVSICIFFLRRSICILLRVRKPKDSIEMDQITGVESLQFDFITIRSATDNFSDANKLGRGGFGAVYRGKLLNGQEIAVKRLLRNSGQGDLEFKNEVWLVAKLQHRNLVRLLGFCLERSERLLIYEFVLNTSLDHYLFDPMERAHLNWERRYKIIRGIARGILYLHEDSRLRIIHRDLKAGNILLDAEMNPKIADFGMARMVVLDQTEGSTNRIVGTYGYMAPEYAMFGQFSIKSDVFSFGVLILEIVSGQKITSFCNEENTEHLLIYAWKNWREGTISNLIDLTLSSSPITEIMRIIHIGLLCVQENVADRPNMASVVLMINSNSIALTTPTQPASFMRSNILPATSLQQDIGSNVSVNKVSITELSPR